MNILDAMRAIVEVQKTIAITEPVALEVKTAFLTVPPSGETVANAVPCWTNALTMQPVTVAYGQRSHIYTVNMRLHVGQAMDGDTSILAERAIAFIDPTIRAFQAQTADGIGGLKLRRKAADGTVTSTAEYVEIRGGDPTVAVFGDTQARTIGLDFYLDVYLQDAFTGS